MTDATSKPRWYRLTPDRFVIGLLVVECLLWFSERYQWFGFNRHKGWTVLIGVAAVGGAMLVMLLWFVASVLFRFQFSIRSLLVLTLAVALSCSWFAVEMKKATEQQRLVDEITRLGGRVIYDWQVDAAGYPLPKAQPAQPVWLWNLLGDKFFSVSVQADLLQTEITDDGLQLLDGLHQLKVLSLGRTEITDAGLAHLEGLNQLQNLELGDTHVTDAGLAHLAGLNQLEYLSLGSTQVTDAGLAHLKGLSRLRDLCLNETRITDAGLKHLEGLNQLRELSLNNTQVTGTGLQHLKGLTQLQVLWIEHTGFTDVGLSHLEPLTQLSQLYLDYTQITDAGLVYLAGLNRLRVLWVGPKVTNEGKRKLSQALPNCGIAGGG